MPISQDHVDVTCLVGRGAETCRYLSRGPEGWMCAKSDPQIRAAIDARAPTMTAQGDNCDGWPL